MAMIPEEIERHYREGREEDRLAGSEGALERLRTESVLRRFLPPAPAVVVDVGGAAGVHAFPLAARGYRVHLIDPVERHLEEAGRRAAETGVALASIARGDARALDLAAGSADAILLLGPLYHLVEAADRAAALREARRVLKPGGVLIAAAISRFASLLDGLRTGAFGDPAFRAIVAVDLASGQHRNPDGRPEYFTTAFFHRPEELAREVRGAAFEEVRLLAVEGPGWSAARLSEAMADEGSREALLDHLARIEEEPSLLGASAHLLAVAR